MAMDGQYTCLNVGKHMHDKPQIYINLSWDSMHSVELPSNDSTSVADYKLIENTVTLNHETLSNFKGCNKFELLYSEKELFDTFYTPKLFKDMKFVT